MLKRAGVRTPQFTRDARRGFRDMAPTQKHRRKIAQPEPEDTGGPSSSSSSSAAAAGAESQRSARRDSVVKSILHSIFSRETVGGDRLVEEELAERLGVSRTPVREALRELAAIGVIWLKPNHGAMVRPFGARQLLEIYHMRRLLESEATRLATRAIDHNELRRIRAGMQQLSTMNERPAGWGTHALDYDGQLHQLIAHSSGSERLAEEIHRYWTLAQAIAEAVQNVSQTQEYALKEHTDIIDRLLERKAEDACRAMARHIDQRAQAALQALCPPFGREALREILDLRAAMAAGGASGGPEHLSPLKAP
jgi:DNA-binding GntR family transcriptional regulator